jgi:hypothetical protein
MIAYTIAIGFPQLISAEKELIPAVKPLFHLQGKAWMGKDGVISISIRNVSPDGCDYLIGYGKIEVENVYEEDSKNIIKVIIYPHNDSGGVFVRVSSSDPKANLLIAEQMYRSECKLPEEYKNTKFDAIDIQLFVFKLPNTNRKCYPYKSTVVLPLKYSE